MDAKSVITNLAPKPLLITPGHTVSGIAWSGRGKIKEVHVSLMEEKTEKSTIDGPSLDRSVHRFYYELIGR